MTLYNDDTIARQARLHPVPDVFAPEPQPDLAPGPDWRHRADRAVSLLLVVQALSLFVVIPLGASTAYGRVLLDGCHLAFAGIAVTLLRAAPRLAGAARRRADRAGRPADDPDARRGAKQCGRRWR